MKSVVFFNNKGGVGKTTLLCNVASFIAKYEGKKICVVDCDPQCNATQYMFDDETIDEIYSEAAQDTVYSLFEPLMSAKGYGDAPARRHSQTFGIDILCGDPRLSLAEDFLAEDWASINTPRGLKSTLVFRDLLSKLEEYDYVFFDVSPSLGALNRSILLTSDYFLSPMSIDVFSLKAFENISAWISKWNSAWEYAIGSPTLDQDSEIVAAAKDTSPARFIGYVSQQYVSRRDRHGNRRPVLSYEKIIQQIDTQIEKHFPEKMRPENPMEIGKIPNLFSLIPMSQSSRKPVFELAGTDGVVGAHFSKVKEARAIFEDVSKAILERV